jgi:NAD(P)-dependent dehydrogenase (short-subunit alcohol dehydrogenase family)
VRTVVVGASSGLGRCIGVGLARRGHRVALLARRRDRLEKAAAEAGEGAAAIACDVTDGDSCRAAVEEAAGHLSGIDSVVYAPAIGPLRRIEDVDAGTWTAAFATNVTGASLMAAAALPHLEESHGRMVFLSSVSASLTPPWPGLGAYLVSKAALEKLVQVWRTEHPEVGFTSLVVGDCAGGEGDAATGFASGWDPHLAVEMGTVWVSRGLIAGCFVEVEDLVDSVHHVLGAGASLSLATVVVSPRPGPTNHQGGPT